MNGLFEVWFNGAIVNQFFSYTNAKNWAIMTADMLDQTVLVKQNDTIVFDTSNIKRVIDNET